ncbi:MAG: hypothetical protein ACK56I_19895, partial [bacterium]
MRDSRAGDLLEPALPGLGTPVVQEAADGNAVGHDLAPRQRREAHVPEERLVALRVDAGHDPGSEVGFDRPGTRLVALERVHAGIARPALALGHREPGHHRLAPQGRTQRIEHPVDQRVDAAVGGIETVEAQRAADAAHALPVLADHLPAGCGMVEPV